MPTYAYRCTACGHAFDVRQSFTDAPLTECPECGGALRKVLQPVGVVFKGSGFYRTDSRESGKKGGSSSATSGGSSDSGSTSASSTASSGEKSGSGSTSGGSTSSSSSASGSSGSTSTGTSTTASKPSA
ncbi:FmdB family transcriptional regulator [Miniimonas arenae]|uniref:FmdB family transcriptional regulator n=1 Tax=Miniimonas arenae TaxID=676201 RepID=A0A5C5BC33_9MICO|nr:FmdB family zinc ribbon protein [Miniimonas arenae]TNU73642.1 FmdB family transcriptional regulator [Miniimonas arenae]